MKQIVNYLIDNFLSELIRRRAAIEGKPPSQLVSDILIEYLQETGDLVIEEK